MTLLQLRYLLAIADNGLDVGAAADELRTSRPGVRRQLDLLEEELGEALFDRHGRSLRAITPAGQDVLAHARVIAAEVEAIRGRVGRSAPAGRLGAAESRRRRSGE